MVSIEDVDTILTTQDLAEHLKQELLDEGMDSKIALDYKSGELFINCEGYTHGMSIGINSFGIWVIHELISHENDGVYAQTGNYHKTESTMTVMRAIAKWMVDAIEPKPVPTKLRLGFLRNLATIAGEG